MTGPRYIEEHTALWRGVSLRIQWEPQFLNTSALVQPGHLQIESTEPRRAPLPITETGYLSWFTSPTPVQESGGPVALVLQWLDAEAAGPAWAQVATPLMALEAAADVARRAGVAPLILSDAIEGEAREVGRVMAGIARSVAAHGLPLAAPCVLLSGGETTVTIRGAGRGGRNVEFLLALGAELAGPPCIHALVGDTDGVDGIDEIAGAILRTDTPTRAATLGLSFRTSLDRNDGHGFFEALGDAIITGPTLTNVNDFRAILIV